MRCENKTFLQNDPGFLQEISSTAVEVGLETYPRDAQLDYFRIAHPALWVMKPKKKSQGRLLIVLHLEVQIARMAST